MGKAGWHHSEETKKRIAEARRAYFSEMSFEERVAFADKVSAGVRVTVSTMSYEERQRKFGGRSEARRQYYADHPEVAEQIGCKMSKTRRSLSIERQEEWARNAATAHEASPFRKLSYNDDWRQHISESGKLLWTDEKRREQSERSLRQWLEGRWGEKSLGTGIRNRYPGSWEFIKMVIRERDEYVCRLCGSDGTLHVHHINYDSADCRWENLITLCDSHHMQTNYDREYWQKRLAKMMEGEKVIA